MPRIFNFSAGPAVLPEPVLEDCKANLLDYKGCGMSVMELSHRGPEFMDIIARAEADLRSLLSIPDTYDVLFLQGGASGQFAALPLNLTVAGDTVDCIVTGSWSKKVRGERYKRRDGVPAWWLEGTHLSLCRRGSNFLSHKARPCRVPPPP
jgi:phosphoserine aminotransferase